MSKKSVFKFTINDVAKSKETIDSIIMNYLEENNFTYNNNEKCYIIGNPSEREANINMAKSIVYSLQSNNLITYANLHRCFEYEILENQLIIKAYILNAFSNNKVYIHSKINSDMACKEYYSNLQTELFDELKENDIILSSVEIEKVKDGSTLKFLRKTLMIITPIIIIFAVIAIVSYCSTH